MRIGVGHVTNKAQVLKYKKPDLDRLYRFINWIQSAYVKEIEGLIGVQSPMRARNQVR